LKIWLLGTIATAMTGISRTSAKVASQSVRVSFGRSARAARSGLSKCSGGKIFLALDIDCERDEHTDSRRAEAPVPAFSLAERADDKGRRDHTRIDTEIEDLEGVRAPQIGGLVERADLAGDIAIEHARAEDEAEQGEQEARFERHQEVAGRHGDRPDEHGPALAEHPIREQAAEYGSQVDQGEIGADDGRGERLPVDIAVKPAEAVEEGDVPDIGGAGADI
jgi:hypothetical protein